MIGCTLDQICLAVFLQFVCSNRMQNSMNIKGACLDRKKKVVSFVNLQFLNWL